ncbi:Immunoglobulin domain [Nesidiocoris tenuis]|uniref:Immunoglobulin domain n=1 Tax=Nesidiocoris tenuis TaxID=355587 RepID=A0ABN7AMR2_9HEMI|nr:Immunoglobulin domain [Nesidiocoris tenuis]
MGHHNCPPSIDGVSFNLTRINRLHMGAYLCIASNGWPPSVSKRIMLLVHFPPMIWIQNQLVGAMEGERMTLECLSEAFPKSINYWTRESGDIISQGPKFEPSVVENSYKIQMKLTIHNVALSDFGSYKCVSKNSLGETDGTIKLYQIPTPTTTTTTTLATTMTTEMVIPTTERPRTPKPERKKSKDRKKVVQEVNEIAPIPSDDRRQAVQPGPIKIEENRHETKMDRSSHFPMAHESSASLRCLPQSLLPLQAILLLLLLNSRHLSLPFHR